MLFSVLASISLAIVFLQTNLYRSEAAIFVKLGRESVALDPTVTTTSTIALNETREGEVNSIVEVLRSRAIAERVVDEFGAETILSGFLPDGDAVQGSWVGQTIGALIDVARRFNDGRDVSLRERATRRLMKDLDVSIPKKSTVLLLKYDTKSPELAQKVLARILEVFQDEHARINRMVGTYDFLMSQKDTLERRLNISYEALRKEKNRLQLVSIEGARQKLQAEYAMLSQQLLDASTELVAVQASISSLQEEMGKLPDQLPSESVSGLPNVATDGMRETLFQLQVREQELLSKYTDKHPSVVQVRKLVAEAESIYKEQGQQREQQTTAIHPSKQKLEVLYLTQKSTAASLTHRIEVLNRHVENAQQRMVALTEGEIRIDNLQREVEMTEASFRNYNDRLEQARMDQELRSEKISNLNIVQPPSYAEKPVGLPRLLLLIGGVSLAFMGSAGVLMIPELKQWFGPQDEPNPIQSDDMLAEQSARAEWRESRSSSRSAYERDEVEPVAESFL